MLILYHQQFLANIIMTGLMYFEESLITWDNIRATLTTKKILMNWYEYVCSGMELESWRNDKAVLTRNEVRRHLLWEATHPLEATNALSSEPWLQAPALIGY